MELKFSLDSSDIRTMAEKADLKAQANYDARLKKIDTVWHRAIPLLFKYAIPLFAIIVFYCLPEWGIVAPRTGSPLSAIIALVIVIALYAVLWRRYGNACVQYLIARHSQSRVRAAIRHQTLRVTKSATLKSLSKFEGLHRVRLENSVLTFTSPANKASAIAVTKIAYVREKEAFYQIATELNKKLGLCYVIAKKSKAMDEDEYQEALKQILAAIRLNAPNCRFEEHSAIPTP
ncbi:hypothetical protein [Leminorella grimontii]|uniref:hypothetical protein n=1 Tax=Leminorella grimontii TaxID=82981 RepID=UPI00321F9BDD